jgi:hypothetical protein
MAAWPSLHRREADRPAEKQKQKQNGRDQGVKPLDTAQGARSGRVDQILPGGAFLHIIHFFGTLEAELEAGPESHHAIGAG